MDRATLFKHFGVVAAQAVAAALVYALLRGSGAHEFTLRDIDGITTMILLLGSIYAVMFAFVIFVIWGQFTEVENFVMRECNALNDLLRFGRHLNADTYRPIRRAVTDYAQSVLHSEWPALAERNKDDDTERCFAKLLAAVIRAEPASPAEASLHQRLIDIARKAGEHRDDRVTKSLTRIPPTLHRLVIAMAAGLILLILVYPFHRGATGLGCLLLVGLVLAFANLVMTDTDNPFRGVCNVSPRPFSDLLL